MSTQPPDPPQEPSSPAPPPPPPPSGSGTPPAPAPSAGWAAPAPAPSGGWAAPAQAAGAAGQPQWRSLQGLTKTLTALFVIHIVLDVLVIIGVINHLRVLSDHEVNGVVIPVKPVNDANAFPASMIVLAGLVSIAIFVLLIIWLYRAAKNNEALGRRNPKLGPGWAIGGWFIPIAWWVIPFIVLDDVWRGSDPSVPRDDPNWRRSPTFAAIWAWMVTAIVLTIPNAIAGSGGNARADEPGKVRRGDILHIIGTAGAIIAGVLAIVVIRRVADRQEECLRAQQSAWQPSPQPPPPA